MPECAKCDRTNFDPRKAWPEVAGWSRPRNLRGGQSGSSLIGREKTGRMICDECAVRIEHGLPTGQDQLGPIPGQTTIPLS